MKVLFSNPPWWEGEEEITVRVDLAAIKSRLVSMFGNGLLRHIKIERQLSPSKGIFRKKVKRYRQGVRAGSRWPYTFVGRSSPDHFVFGDYIPYPFFMGYATTYSREMTGYDVRMRDSIALKESYDTFYKFIQKEQFDFIFIESATPSWEHDRDIILSLKKLSPHTKVVITGPIATLGEKILRDFPIHAVIKGEYEKGSVAVLQGTSGLLDFDLLTEKEMNLAPFPYFDDTICHRYWDSKPLGQRFPHAQIWSSRGCPFKCIFCVWPATMTGNDPSGDNPRKVRYYSPKYIECLVNWLKRKYRYKSIYFDDDTFNLGDKHTIEICGVMKKIGLPWSAMCRTDTIKFNTWQVMKESGCFGVKLGFESGNQFVVDKIVNKKLNLNNAREVVNYLKNIGMTVHGTFTFGLPGETQDQMHDTVKFIDDLKFDSVQYSGCAEIEGTPLSYLSQNENKLKGYEGAAFAGYDHKSDGGKKWEEISSKLYD